mmetsp:Transcript_16313/g.51249  ORF Transcript_16313/g.51249 Transcript_16313/m.51249 type:complete len:311 (-) Transcript_16313:589-1521(-)
MDGHRQQDDKAPDREGHVPRELPLHGLPVPRLHARLALARPVAGDVPQGGTRLRARREDALQLGGRGRVRLGPPVVAGAVLRGAAPVRGAGPCAAGPGRGRRRGLAGEPLQGHGVQSPGRGRVRGLHRVRLRGPGGLPADAGQARGPLRPRRLHDRERADADGAPGLQGLGHVPEAQPHHAEDGLVAHQPDGAAGARAQAPEVLPAHVRPRGLRPLDRALRVMRLEADCCAHPAEDGLRRHRRLLPGGLLRPDGVHRRRGQARQLPRLAHPQDLRQDRMRGLHQSNRHLAQLQDRQAAGNQGGCRLLGQR